MKKLLFSATFVATLLGLGLGASVASGQQQGGVAIIDMSYIFKEHHGFKARTASMKAEVEAAEADLKERKNAIASKAKQLDELDKGSADYKALESQLTKAQADLQADVALKKKEFLEKESGIYYKVYIEVLDAVKKVAHTNGIDIVLRFNGDKLDPNDPQNVLKELNKTVVYYNEAIDITPIILTEVNRGQRVGTTPDRGRGRQSVPRRK